MPRRRRRRDETYALAEGGFLPDPFLKGSKKDLVCYIPPGSREGFRVWGPANEWNSDRDKRRDSELCKRIWEQTGATVRACYYRVGSSPAGKNGVCKPHNWIRLLYDWAKKPIKYERLHLVGYSGGAMLASSQLAFYPRQLDRQDPIVRTLVLIAGDVAAGLDKPHRNAAFFADRVKAKTRLIWGTNDNDAKSGAEEWTKRNDAADPQPYTGGHDFYDDGQFDNVTQMIVDWLTKEPAIKRLAERKRIVS